MSRYLCLIAFCCCFGFYSLAYAQLDSYRMSLVGQYIPNFTQDDVGVPVSEIDRLTTTRSGDNIFVGGWFGPVLEQDGWIQRVTVKSPWNPQGHEVWYGPSDYLGKLIAYGDSLGIATNKPNPDGWGSGWGGLIIYELSESDAPNELGRTAPDSGTTWSGRDIAVYDNHVYTAQYGHHDYLGIYNISDLQNPLFVNRFDNPPRTFDATFVEVFDEKLFVGTQAGSFNQDKNIRVYDISSSPANPVFLTESPLLINVYDMIIKDSLAYVAAGDSLLILDISDLSFSQIAAIPANEDPISRLFIDGDLLYVGAWDRITIYDISNPAQPQEIAHHWYFGNDKSIIVKDELIYTGFGKIFRLNAADYSYTVKHAFDFRFNPGWTSELQEYVVTFTNNGDNAMTFTNFKSFPEYVTPDIQSLTLAPGEVGDVTLSAYYINDTTGRAHFSFSHDGASQSDTIKISGRLIQNHTVDFFGASELDFGTVHLDSSTQRTFRLVHTHGDLFDLMVAYVTSNSDDFIVESLPAIFTPPTLGDIHTMTVTFKPTRVGQITDTLTLEHNFEHQRPLRLIVTGVGEDNLTSIEDETEDVALPDEFSLSQNYPNPFNPTTHIEFALPQATDVRLEIYDIRGVQVRTLVNSLMPAGYHNTKWDGRNDAGNAVSSGIYVLQMQAGEQHFVKKMTLLR